jgi:hypothetical protein
VIAYFGSATSSVTIDTCNHTCPTCCSGNHNTVTFTVPRRPEPEPKPFDWSLPRDGRWRQHDMAWHAFVWPAPAVSGARGVPRLVAPPVRRFGREGLGVRNWRRP